MAERKPVVPRKSTSRSLKTAHRKHNKNHDPVSLKSFVRKPNDSDVEGKGKDWFFNKRANFAKPPKGIGSTRKKKGAQKK